MNLKIYTELTLTLRPLSICLQFLNSLSLATPCKLNQIKMIFQNMAPAVGSNVMKEKSYVTC